jgi:hypothetical protein
VQNIDYTYLSSDRMCKDYFEPLKDMM